MKKKIIYVDFIKKRRINFIHFKINKFIYLFTNKIDLSFAPEISIVRKNNKAIVTKI